MSQPQTIPHTAPTPARPAEDLLPAETSMGAVTLLVGDLDLMTRYYRDAVLLTVLRAEGNEVSLGRHGTELLVLRHDPSLPPGSPRGAGLFHTAILFEDQAALATALASVAVRAPGTYVGAGDHDVSEAFYFTDPEGNGVELYADRPRSTWDWTGGHVKMGTGWLDPNRFLAAHLTDAAREVIATAAPVVPTAPAAGLAGAVVGHVHLQVGDTGTARQFYVDALGFEATLEMPGQALFVSAGGYHHHMAMNTWNSAGAGPRLPALGLGTVDIVVPSTQEILALADRLAARGVQSRHDGAVLRVNDPWNNLIEVRAAA
ncbi:VOC family protein [Georgenia sp. SYP-B2076]|uniref:VOC family protein n=1 Tax=Georgenia sp. SYP-B2076 TaxID=2495881 RepID=UPI001F0BACB0|nr:VOC family protein [Georgenia sp. SYP-B2076]